MPSKEQEIIEQIKIAEQQADQIVSEAKNESSFLIEKARSDRVRKLEKAKNEAREILKKKIDEARDTKQFEHLIIEAEKESAKLIETNKDKISRVAKEVAKFILDIYE
ncbi:MAG: hypothetical protein KAU62_02475 [Candidatus Heimdallarchaeota archaeon]|nr:hypothetical protein [Candidatus Heimdallarchaeota archaeon]MCG3254926.1 hypothetical protein [Candidatus Heimdallarchaeota archaeon]MCK4610001.1 hypothetical protein [Candidatus Heimdallarchaeota archaeon]